MVLTDSVAGTVEATARAEEAAAVLKAEVQQQLCSRRRWSSSGLNVMKNSQLLYLAEN
jgi:hypothetical protein